MEHTNITNCVTSHRCNLFFVVLFSLFRLRRVHPVLTGMKLAVISIFLPVIRLFCTKQPRCRTQIFNGHHDPLGVARRASNWNFKEERGNYVQKRLHTVTRAKSQSAAFTKTSLGPKIRDKENDELSQHKSFSLLLPRKCMIYITLIYLVETC